MFWITSESSAAVGPLPNIVSAREEAESLQKEFVEPVFIYTGNSFLEWRLIEKFS
jgi:hypothetical protein